MLCTCGPFCLQSVSAMETRLVVWPNDAYLHRCPNPLGCESCFSTETEFPLARAPLPPGTHTHEARGKRHTTAVCKSIALQSASASG